MSAALSERALSVPRALAIVLASRRAKIATGAVFVLFSVFYAMLLPATYTSGVIGLVSLRYLTPGMLGLALVMAALLALTLSLGVYGFQQGAGAKPAGSVVGAILAALPPLLCCSPILPLAIAMVAAVLPAARAFGVPIQGFIATHEGTLYAIATGLMAWGLYGNARRVLACPHCLLPRGTADAGCAIPTTK